MIVCSDDPLWVRAAWVRPSDTLLSWYKSSLELYLSATHQEFFWAYDRKDDLWLYHNAWGEYK